MQVLTFLTTDRYLWRMNIERLSMPQRLMAIAIVVVIIAAFLPWVSLFGFSASGLDTDGRITLLLGIGGAAVLALSTGLIGKEQIPANIGEIALAVLGGIVALIGLMDMNSAAAIGLYLTLLGGVAWAGLAGWQLYLSKQGNSTPTDGPAQQD